MHHSTTECGSAVLGVREDPYVLAIFGHGVVRACPDLVRTGAASHDVRLVGREPRLVRRLYDVVAVSAVEQVGAYGALVAARRAPQVVVPFATVDLVVVGVPGVDRVGATKAEDAVVALAEGDPIYTGEAVDGVGAVAPVDRVLAPAPVDRVVAVVAVYSVVPAPGGDNVGVAN